MDLVGYFPSEITQVVWETSYCWQREADPATGFRREVKEVQISFIFPDQMLPGCIHGSRTSQGERQVHEKQDPLVPWLELPLSPPPGIQLPPG